MCGTLQRGRKLSGQHHRKHLLLGAILPTVVILEAVTLTVAQDTGQANSAVTSIKVNVGVVNLNVSVSDRTGRPYAALKAENFRVYDNGAEQMIHHFSSYNVPFTLRPVLDRSGIMFIMMEEVPGGTQH